MLPENSLKDPFRSISLSWLQIHSNQQPWLAIPQGAFEFLNNKCTLKIKILCIIWKGNESLKHGKSFCLCFHFLTPTFPSLLLVTDIPSPTTLTIAALRLSDQFTWKEQEQERSQKLGVDSKGSWYWQVLSSLVMSPLPAQWLLTEAAFSKAQGSSLTLNTFSLREVGSWNPSFSMIYLHRLKVELRMRLFPLESSLAISLSPGRTWEGQHSLSS